MWKIEMRRLRASKNINKTHLETHEDRIDYVNFIPITAPDSLAGHSGHTPDGMLWTAQGDNMMLREIPLAVGSPSKYRHRTVGKSNENPTLYMTEKPKKKLKLSILGELGVLPL